MVKDGAEVGEEVWSCCGICLETVEDVDATLASQAPLSQIAQTTNLRRGAPVLVLSR